MTHFHNRPAIAPGYGTGFQRESLRSDARVFIDWYDATNRLHRRRG